jgi:hypothetical protein
MIKYFILSVLFLTVNVSFSQDSLKLQELQKIKVNYEKIIKLFEDSLMVVNGTISQMETDLLIKNIYKKKYTLNITTWTLGGRLLEEPKSDSKYICLLETGEDILIKGYAEGYWYAEYNKYLGYVNNDIIGQTTETERIVKYSNIQKNELEKKERQENYRLDNVKFREADRVLEAEKLRIKKIREKVALEMIMEEQRIRRANLINKYGKTNADRIIENQYWIGMTGEMAKESLGYPDQNNRSVGNWGVHEQWVYSEYDIFLYFENGKLTSYQN